MTPRVRAREPAGQGGELRVRLHLRQIRVFAVASDTPSELRVDEEMDADVSIPARFEKVMQAVTDGYGTRSRGHHSV